MKDTAFYTKNTLALLGNLINLSQPRIMGILNITPDSFYDGGKYSTSSSIARQAELLAVEGADIIDIGGYSSRPGAIDINEETEKKRVLEGLRVIRESGIQLPVSVDTFRSSVADIALQNGASMINDISGGNMDEAMLSTIAHHQVPYVLMHMVGPVQQMQQNTGYTDVFTETLDYFAKKLLKCTQLGLKDVIIDVGFGFSKTIEQNYTLMDKLPYFQILNRPILVGISRKSMIYKVLNTNPAGALNGTTVLNTLALIKGASILRVHDVSKTREVLTLINQMHQ